MTIIQIDMLKVYADSNLNRDDLGSPKSSNFGGVNRTRISSQCTKRAWRTSDIFQKLTDGSVSVRTRMIGDLVRKKMEGKNCDDVEKAIKAIRGAIIGEKGEDDKTVMCLSKKEIKNIRETLLQNEKISILEKENLDMDIALWGRMLASNPGHNVEASCQVSHAITTHAKNIDTDYFIATDDLQPVDSTGSAHIGEFEFSNGVFHQYISVDLNKLYVNLDRDIEKVKMAVKALLCATSMVTPSGKQNSFATPSYAEHMLVRSSDVQPFSLVNAFEEPVPLNSKSLLGKSKEKLMNYFLKNKDSYDAFLGLNSEKYIEFDTEKGHKFSEVLSFCEKIINEVL